MQLPSAENVGLEIRAAMARGRKTQTDVALALGISQAAVSRRLRGDVAFDVVQLYQLADYLEVDVADLLPAAAVA